MSTGTGGLNESRPGIFLWVLLNHAERLQSESMRPIKTQRAGPGLVLIRSPSAWRALLCAWCQQKEGRARGNAGFRLNCSSSVLLSVPSACSLTSGGLEGCLSLLPKSSHFCQRYCFLWQKQSKKKKIFSPEEHELRVQSRSDHLMDFQPSCHPVDSGSVDLR